MADKNKEGEWVGIDLHVHTPASLDYKGSREDVEYQNILRQANEFRAKDSGGDRKSGAAKAALACIAFTDHNSVEGFRKYKVLYNETLDLANIIRARDPKNPLLQELDKELKVWESVRVLMGIEIKADPGIDLLVVFHESVDPDEAIQFLERAYGRSYSDFSGNPTPTTGKTLVDTLSLLTECFGDKAIVVAPHVDSSGGVYEGLKDYGQTRARIFRHPALKALSFNKEETRDRIRAIFSQPDYRRPDNVALVQSSDFHGQKSQSVGQPRTEVYVPRGKATFANIRDAFSDPKRVKCSIDFTQQEYTSLVKDRHVVRFASAHDETLFRKEDFQQVAKSVCSMLNTDGGLIEIEAIVRADAGRDSYIEPLTTQLRDEILAQIDPKPARILARDLRISPGKIRVLFMFARSTKLNTLDGVVWVIRGQEACRATSLEIEHVVSRNIDARFGYRFESTLEQVSEKSTLLSKMSRGIPLVLGSQHKLHFGLPKQIEVVNARRAGPVDRETEEEILDLYEGLTEHSPFGDPRGNVSFIPFSRAPRETDHYLRFSAVRFELDPSTAERLGATKIEQHSLAVTIRGNIQSVEPGYLISVPPVLLLQPQGEWKDRVYSLLAWLKSSFFVWYCAVHLGDPDAFLQFQLRRRKLALPASNSHEIWQRLDSFARNMILDENKFMDEINRQIRKGAFGRELRERERSKFNKTANKFCLDLDSQISSYLGLSKKDEWLIADTLREIHLTDFGFAENEKTDH